MKTKVVRSLLIATVVLVLATLALVGVDRDRFHPDWGANAAIRLLNNLEWGWYDVRFQSKPVEYSRHVLVAKIDDKSLERFGRWPWSRALYAKILESLYGMGAEAVGFDAVFSEPEYNREYLKKSMQDGITGESATLAEDLKLTPEQLEGLAENLPKVGDRIFGTGVNEFPRTVLGYIWQGTDECTVYDPESKFAKELSAEPLTVEQAKQRGYVHVDTLVDNLGAIQNQSVSLLELPVTAKVAFPKYACPIANRSDLSAKAKFQGYFNAIPDSDGLYRRMPLVLMFSADKVPKSQADFLPPEWSEHPTFFPSLSLQTLISYFNPGQGADKVKPKIRTRTGSAGELVIESVGIPRAGAAELVIPTLPDGSILINFLGSQTAKPQAIGDFSLAEVPFREDRTQVPPSEFSSEQFRGVYGIASEIVNPLAKKTIVIGPTAMGVYDLRPNPAQGDAPGVYLHASVLARVLDYASGGPDRISVRFLSLPWSLAFLWLMGLALAFWLAKGSAAQGALSSAIALVIIAAADYGLFTRLQIVTNFTTTVLGIASVALAILAYKYFTEERERAFVKGAFEKFVSPDVIKQIEADPKRLNLGGEKKELTVVFSDIRGFTNISEKMKADELARFMNSYLSPMTDVVLEHRGTIDKYMGDAIMAIFGAPVEYANHAEKAVDAALGMMVKLEELKTGWIAQGLPPMDIGIGMNTGDMSVGNMGSQRIMAYTVMGDSVNLGSRLESINKEYHTHIIVSEFTRRQLGPDYVVRELDRVKVKGKLQPVTIFEAVGKAEVPAERRELIRKFETALYLYYDRKFAEAKALFAELTPTDGTAQLYVGRCESWMAEAPADDWDGSWTMKSK